MRTRLTAPILVLLAALCSCAAPIKQGPMQAEPLTLSPPSQLCKDPLFGQKDLCMPTETLERLLRDGAMTIEQVKHTSSAMSVANVWVIDFPEKHVVVRAKWKEAEIGGDGVNNTPRREIAAYKVQQLFLEAPEYVVPPTVGRCIKREYYQLAVRDADPTFKGGDCIFGVLSYWLENVQEAGKVDPERMKRDPIYRDSVANMNLLAYLIDHKDVRASNFLISKDPERPRVFSVDNGMAFSGVRHPAGLGTKSWQDVRFDAYPKASIDRLRKITRADLDKLAVVAQYERKDGQVVEVAAAEPIQRGKGVLEQGATIQLGLTPGEIEGVEKRLRALLEEIR